uniref:Synaptonemal complex protein 2 n=1 Tax=Canis lupus familiaris TaxID=9615 RepID=A0A8I3S1I7_CANLF
VKNDFEPLKTLLQIDICEDVKIKCSKQFLHKLDGLICRELNKKDIQIVSTILVSFGRCGKNITILGQAGLLTMIKQGLIQKISMGFKSKDIILRRGNSKDEAIINVIEDLFDLLMVKIMLINQSYKRQVVESFVPRICVLVTDSRVNICIQQETLKKMNAMLDKMPQDARKILSNQEMLILIMTTEKQRQELACHWFSMDFIANAFKGIKDSEFETDCRVFLNLVNGMLGDKRRVFTFPCLSAFLDKYELQIPSDEKLEEFWIDFNLGSQTLSFYIAGDNDDHHWEAVTVPEDKVQIYSIEVRESKKLLTIILKNIIKISKREGKELLLYFDASLEITNVTRKIFGASKYREFTRKQGISVAKTSVHILFDASGSQILVPESQTSPIEEELITLKEKPNSQKEDAKPPKNIKSSSQIITPGKRKMSEASMIVPGADRYTVRSPILLTNTSAPRRGRTKPPLQMTSSAEKPVTPKMSEGQVGNAVSLISRPSEERNSGDNTDKYIKQVILFSRLPGVLYNICGNKMPSKWSCWTPVTNINLCNSQRAGASSGDTFSQGIIHQKHMKQKSPSSISEDNSEETEKVQYKKKTQQNKIEKAEVGVCKRDTQQQLNNLKHSEQKNTENTKQRDWHIESETTFKSVLLNKTVEESLIYRKKYILSKDVNTAICDKNPSPRKNVKSHRKSGKKITSELNSWDLRQKKMREKSKEKGFTDAAESLINQINKRYKTKDNIQSTRKFKESLIDRYILVFFIFENLLYIGVNISLYFYRNDVYNFNLNGADEPIIKLGTVTDPKNKNLFSDTDTEYVCDDSKTDVSWLKEPKSKPQLIDYSRNKNVKKHKSGKPRPSLERGQPKSKMTPNKNITKKVEERVPDGRIRLPRRATKTKKNYKDLSNSESENEQEFSLSFKEKLLVKEENIHSRSKTMKLPKKQQNTFSAEKQKDIPSSLPKDAIRDNSLGLSPISLSGSPSSIEVMRCTEKIRERDFTQDFDGVTKSLSPSLKTSPESSNSKYGVGGPIKSPTNSDKKLCARESCSLIPQSFFNTVMNRKNINSVVYSDVSTYSSEKTGNRSTSPLSMSSEGREQIWCDMPCDSTHVSDSIQHISCKRMYVEDNLSSADEVELEKEEEGRVCLIPKKRSKNEDSSWLDYFIKSFQLQLSVFQVRQKIMDYFTKQSWKTAQQHLNTMNQQIQEYRINKLEKFQFIIIEELENYEKDSQSLKDLEKEFVSKSLIILQQFKMITTKVTPFVRLHLLKASLEKNVFYNTDYEDTVFRSEMCSMKENMKMLQDRLLKETVSPLSGRSFTWKGQSCCCVS